MTYYVLMVKTGNITAYWTGKGFALTDDKYKAKTWKTITGAFKGENRSPFLRTSTFVSER